MSFFGSFTGSTQRRDLRAADARAGRHLERGYGDQTRRYDEAYDSFSPYAQQGRAASDIYYNALGANGAEAQTGALDTITGNPLFQGQLGQDSNAMLKYMNARGQGAGGAAALAGQRVFQQTAGNWLDRYRDAGRQGLEVTGQQANIRMGQGDNAMGYGATRAGQAINMGNAVAGTRSIGINNLMNLAGTAARAYAGGL